MKLRSALVAAGLLALPAAAMAQPVDGLYVGAGAGYNWAQDLKIRTSSGVGSNLSTNGGWLGTASVGYGLGNGFRVEVQGDYRNYHQTFNNGVTLNGSSGGLNQTYGGFVNGLFDFDVGAGMVFPYVGVGIGYEWTAFDSSHFSATEGSVAAQAILGVSFPIPDLAGLSVTAEYRFMTPFEDEKFKNDGISAKANAQYNHAGVIGLRYAFGVEEPAPAPTPVVAPTPAPVVAPARTYLVFFDWDKYDLSARARQIIAEAAQNATKVAVTRIEVNGYADTSGTHAYNLPLSQRRADAVAAELVKDGIPKAEIVEMAYGDTHLLVPTGPGVREPQNRRVEIIIR
jgi:outer membrane protein OmpA-like peptidoglycan-associated protein